MPNLLLKREHSYCFNLRVPKKYAAHYPRSHFRENLKTLDKRKAQRLAAQRWHEIVEEWDRIDRTGSKAKTTITPAEIQALVAQAIHTRLIADDEERERGVDDVMFEHMALMHDEADGEERQFVARGLIDDRLHMVIADWLMVGGYEIDPDSEDYRRFAREFIKAQMKVTKAFMDRHQGNLVETEEVLVSLPKAKVPASSSPTDAPLLSKVIAYFLENSDSSKSMFQKYKVVLPLFLESVGDKPVDQLRQMNIENFAELVCQLPPRWSDIMKAEGITASELSKREHEIVLAPATFKNTYMSSLQAFLSKSQRNFGDVGFLLTLTTKDVEYRGNRKEGERKQRAFTAQELKHLFEGAEMKAFVLSSNEQHKYWLPLIGLYTGARVNEICQLNPQTDIGEEEGIWFFDFNEENETDSRVERSIKNNISVRRVPLHPALISLKFLEYVMAVKVTGSKLLFPKWPPSRGKASGAAEKWFREFLKETGLRDETPGKTLLGMHAFRHTFLNRALNLNVRDAEIITGHAGEKSAVVRGYEGQMGLQRRLEILEQIVFDIDPPKVKKD